MVELTLPKNSRITTGKTWPKPAGATNLKTFKVYRCWVSEFQTLPDLDANANAVAIETIKLENEGWERDTAVTEPTEPTLSA